LLQQNKYFLIPYFIFLFVGGLILLLFNKAEIHLFVNQYHDYISDQFFRFATYVAEGIIVGGIILGLAFYRIRSGLLLLGSYVFASLIAQFFKRLVFNEYPRPKAFFDGIANLRFVEGVQVHTAFSFPSGHATGAFALFFSLAILAKRNYLKAVYFFAALLAAWSRVHLSQHFFIDIYIGSLLGVSVTAFTFLFFNKKFPEGLFLIDQPLKLKGRGKDKRSKV
jgi:membrane-associated phospholipid phosphatase